MTLGDGNIVYRERTRALVVRMRIRVQIWHLSGGNAICVLLNRDGTWRVPPFMLFAAQGRANGGKTGTVETIHRDPIHNQRG